MTQAYKRITFNDDLQKYLLFELTPEKKIINIVKKLKDIFPKQKRWKDLNEERDSKLSELFIKFQKKGRFYKEICKNWLRNNENMIEEFNNYFQDQSKEVSTETVVSFFKELKEKLSLDVKDIYIFIHIYVEQVVGMQLFEESVNQIEQGF